MDICVFLLAELYAFLGRSKQRHLSSASSKDIMIDDAASMDSNGVVQVRVAVVTYCVLT